MRPGPLRIRASGTPVLDATPFGNFVPLGMLDGRDVDATVAKPRRQVLIRAA